MCNQYRKFKNSEILYIFHKTFNYKQLITLKNMVEKNIRQEFTLKSIDETVNYFIEQIEENELISKKRTNVCKILNYIKSLLILASTVTVCVSNFYFCFFSWYFVSIESSAVGINVCAIITAIIGKYNSLIKKKKMKNNKILLTKTKLNIMEVLISKALIDSFTSHDKIVSVNNVLREYDDMKGEIKSLAT